jgi:hypothetical protein
MRLRLRTRCGRSRRCRSSCHASLATAGLARASGGSMKTAPSCASSSSPYTALMAPVHRAMLSVASPYSAARSPATSSAASARMDLSQVPHSHQSSGPFGCCSRWMTLSSVAVAIDLGVGMRGRDPEASGVATTVVFGPPHSPVGSSGTSRLDHYAAWFLRAGHVFPMILAGHVPPSTRDRHSMRPSLIECVPVRAQRRR